MIEEYPLVFSRSTLDGQKVSVFREETRLGGSTCRTSTVVVLDTGRDLKRLSDTGADLAVKVYEAFLVHARRSLHRPVNHNNRHVTDRVYSRLKNQIQAQELDREASNQANLALMDVRRLGNTIPGGLDQWRALVSDDGTVSFDNVFGENEILLVLAGGGTAAFSSRTSSSLFSAQIVEFVINEGLPSLAQQILENR